MHAKQGRLNIIESRPLKSENQIKRRILQCYPLPARLYGSVRFQIIPGQFLGTIEQHLPENGYVLDVGCGLGMFTLYLAMRRPRCQFIAVDLKDHRIHHARCAAKMLRVQNVEFVCEDVGLYKVPHHLDAAYCIDLLHHVTPAIGDRLIHSMFMQLKPGGKIVIKDITTRPRLMLYYTFMLDLLVSPREKCYYRSHSVWRQVLSQIGFSSIYTYPLRNFLPYPHFLLVAQKPTA